MTTPLATNERVLDNAMRLLRSHNTLIVFDTETTGLDPYGKSKKPDKPPEPCYIIELTAHKYGIQKDFSLVPISRKTGYFKPPVRLPEKITEITGITDERLKDMPVIAEKVPAFEKFFGTDALLCGHNLPFDIRFVRAEFERAGRHFAYHDCAENTDTIIDTLVLARCLLPKPLVENHKLMTVAQYFGVHEGLIAHDSQGDVEATARILKKFIAMMLERQKASGGEKVSVYPTAIKFWQGYRGNSRIYVDLTCGDSVYYDIRGYGWGSATLDMSTVNIPELEQTVCKLTGSSNMTEFSRFKNWITVGAVPAMVGT